MYLSRKLIAVWLVLLSTIGVSHSSIITHFELFQDGGQNRLRVVSFNSKTQMMLHHETMRYVQFDKPLSDFLSQYYPAAPLDAEMAYRVKLNAAGQLEISRPAPAVPGLVSRETYLLVTAMPLLNLVGGVAGANPDLHKNFWSSAAIVPKTPAEITAMVPAVLTREAGGDFAITDLFHGQVHLKYLPDKINGDLGELLTVLSVFSYGYMPKPSKYGGNHGLDGIFIRLDHQYLIISQTKAGDSNPRALTLMKNELNEKDISERIQIMLNKGQADLTQSANLVLQFLRDQPERVSKMAHCLLDKGKAQLLIHLVDTKAFPENGPVKLYHAVEADKQTAVRKKVESFAPDPVAQLRLALSSLNLAALPPADALRIMMEALQVNDEKQDRIIEILEEDE